MTPIILCLLIWQSLTWSLSGIKKIAFVGGSDKDNIYRDRFLGYRLSLERNNLSPRDAYVIPTSSNLEEIIQHTTELLRLPEPPDSILCFNSLIAVGVIQAIRQFRLRIPEDISIVSFDNYPYAPLITPSLTVVDIDMYSLGTRAGASLLKKDTEPGDADPDLYRLATFDSTRQHGVTQ